MPWYEILAIVIVGLFIISCPIVFNLFGKETPKEDGSCGTQTLWQKLMSKFKKS